MDSAAANQEFLQLLPGIHPCDGFFIAVFQKKVGPSRHTFMPKKTWAE